MTRIRVDPANLRQAAQQLNGIADRLCALGSETHQATFRAPSYDGQFGPKARAMGREAEARLRAQADRLSALSEELESRAAAFEAVDLETLTAFDRLTQLLRGWMEQAAPILAPYTQIALFPWQKVERYLRWGYLIEEPGDENGEGEEEDDEEEDEWSPPWWSPIAIGAADIWSRTVDGAQGLYGIGIYNLMRASQGAQGLIDMAIPDQNYDEENADPWGEIELQRHLTWLWNNPEVMAKSLTKNPEGQAYLENKVLPVLGQSPTGRVVIRALLERGPVNVNFLPDWLVNPPKLIKPIYPGLHANIQPFGDTIFMFNDAQPGTILAHEGVHLLARESGVDPETFIGHVLNPPYKPGMSLQMEREAYAVSLTIEFELVENDPSLPPNVKGPILDTLSNQIHSLTMEGSEASFQEVLDIGRPNPSDPSAYDGFPTGNDPPRDWREDLVEWD